MRTSDKVTGLAAVAVIMVVLLMGIGWVMNIVEVFGSNFSVITGELILRVIGIFLPFIGGVVGWF